MARIEVTAANFPGSALQGSGTDTLVLVGGGTFDFAYVTLSGFTEIVLESTSGSYATVMISGEQLAGVTSLTRTSSYGAAIYLTGTDIDLRGKTFNNLSNVYIADDNATVTVSSLSLALDMSAYARQGETIVLDGPITTETSRADLHARGFDKIIEGSNVWIDAHPTLTGLSGSFYVREGDSVRLDPEGDATISDAEGRIASLEITLSDSGYYFAMNNFKIGQNFTILDNTFDQILLYQGSEIAQIDSSTYVEGARIVFNQSASADMINEFIRELAYAPGDFVYEENVFVTFTVRDEGGRKAATTIHVNAETNWTPTKPNLAGASVAEDATAGTVVGSLKATDANNDPVNYRLTDDAGGRFRIVNDKLVVSGQVPLDFEQASQHSVTVIANDGEKDGLPATFTISVVDVLEKILGTRGKDKILGARGQEILNGGLGNDILTGGGGKDIFVFNTKLGKTNIDRITDFLPKQDKIHLENAIFKKLGKAGSLKKEAFYTGTKAHDRDDRIIYNKKTGALYYDADGTGAVKAVHFATLSNKAALKYTDLFII